MAITTLDGALAGMLPPVTFAKAATPSLVAGRPHSLFYLSGMPGAAVAPTPGLSGAALTSYAGQLPFRNPPSGNSYLARLQAQATIAGTLILADRLWHNSGLSLTATTAQTINSVAWPARDALGTSNGEQVMIGLEVSTATGAGTPTFTMSYTNQDGVAGKTGTGILTGVATSAIGAFYPIGLAAGDRGVRSIQTFTLSATWTSGAASLVAYRELARLELTAANVPSAIDALTSGFPRLFNDTVPFLIFVPSTTTASNISGQMVITQG
ncbi:hypothetical protein MOJ79_18165 [Calidifontimicrobium sp. SYSU G02091]|uniref:hypothetical protein n=1 Tax=Calidifontimicrobium sp. SYSU G02091 TaxID=2926421 RepID=UPI001F52FD28|nr:hypothetical protein [Calidifontimicrobium sp. SYSU G02091]MCI1193761.1 hypothetical protein [Calidifontimicrobium sp. SYSU G02091]